MISAGQACLLAGWLALAANGHAFPGMSADLQEYETAYACEESLLNITCPVGLNLNIIRANFGRFSIAICNPNGVTDYSVNCMAPMVSRESTKKLGRSVPTTINIHAINYLYCLYYTRNGFRRF